MTMRQPEALRLADALPYGYELARDELRRLHERDMRADVQIKELLQVIEDMERSAEMLSQRVQELERELAAIGAGGVEPLRKTSADTSALRAALEEAEAALEVATSRLAARNANYPVYVTSEARALEIVRKALGKSQADHFRDATKMMLPTAQALEPEVTPEMIEAALRVAAHVKQGGCSMTHKSTEQPESEDERALRLVLWLDQLSNGKFGNAAEAARLIESLHARVQELEGFQARVPLSDAEIQALYNEDSHWDMVAPYVLSFARAIEAAHGITQEKQQ